MSSSKSSAPTYNKVLRESVSLAADAQQESALVRCGRLTQEDWCIMEWSEAEQAYVLGAGVVCFPMRWSLKEQHGMPVACIHRPVFTFGKHFTSRAQGVMAHLKTMQPMWRANWSVFNLDSLMDLFSPQPTEPNAHRVQRSEDGARACLSCRVPNAAQAAALWRDCL
ncbi:hypothetical protein T492DRAFT_1106178 [Pavlovales sp. CCMP2436]|nr:hypothetical protein T492DRAFT_1106178 [Pavlovales sp. CCMP2436]